MMWPDNFWPDNFWPEEMWASSEEPTISGPLLLLREVTFGVKEVENTPVFLIQGVVFPGDV